MLALGRARHSLRAVARGLRRRAGLPALPIRVGSMPRPARLQLHPARLVE